MSNDTSSNNDRDLLSRLNALKQSSVDLDNRSYQPGSTFPYLSTEPTPNPAHALHTDLLSRFKTLSGSSSAGDSAKRLTNQNQTLAAALPIDTIDKSEDDMTIEELLADLGPAEQWDIPRSEEETVDELLKSARLALSQNPELLPEPVSADSKKSPLQENGKSNNIETTATSNAVPAIDVSVFKPEPDSEPESDREDGTRATTTTTKREAAQAFDQEADEVLKRLMDEVRWESTQGAGAGAGADTPHRYEDEGDDDDPTTVVHDESVDGSNHRKQPANRSGNLSAGLDLPTTPSKAPETNLDPDTDTGPAATADGDDEDEDKDLAARFASLSLPSVPTTMASSKQQSSNAKAKPAAGYTDEDIDSWCIICSDDATLSCVGCDGELYCTNCWLEGHRGPDAGLEERRHKAVQYAKGKKKKQKTRIMMGS